MTEHLPQIRHARSLLLFAREPRAGQVKTRLVPALGEAGTLALYRQLLARQIALINSIANADSQLWVDGDPDHVDFQAFRGNVYRQTGGDIGERMNLALTHALATSDAAVLIGCDCPGLDAGYLEQAFVCLEQGCDVVFGPAADGGYVLVGLKTACPDIFRQIAWGTREVMPMTRERLLSTGETWRELAVLHDIDEPDDLAMLPTDAAGRWCL